MHVRIKHPCSILCCQLCSLGKPHPFLSTDAANKLAVSFILTRLDNCNSLLAGPLDNKLNRLQCVQIHAARTVIRKPRHVRATSLLRTLHWLTVKARVCHNTMPPHLSGLLLPCHTSRMLRFLHTSLLSVHRFCLDILGKRSFSVFSPTVWNSLPSSLRKKSVFFKFQKEAKYPSV